MERSSTALIKCEINKKICSEIKDFNIKHSKLIEGTCNKNNDQTTQKF